MNKPITRIGVYLRKSRAEDGVQDLEKHKNYLLNIVKNNNWAYELYEEIDSSQDLNRDEIQRLRHDIALGKIDAIMVHAVDRLSRRSRHFLEIIEDYFIGQGVYKLYVKDTEHDLLDPTTITMLQLQATLSQAEYSFIVARLNEGRMDSVRKGIVTGKLIYGYYFDKTERITKVHEKESKVVRMIIDMLLEGYPYKRICDNLNELGYKTRAGNFWDIHNIKSIAYSPITRGHVIQTWKGEKIEIKNAHPALMTEAEFAQIDKILINRADNYKSLSTAPQHFLQGLLLCPKCKRVMSIAGSKPKRKTVNGETIRFGDHVYYIRACRPYIKQKERCGNWGAPIVDIESAIKSVILEYASQIEDSIEDLLKVDIDGVKKSKKKVINELLKSIKKLESKEQTWLSMVGEPGGFDDNTIFTQVHNLREEKAVLTKKLEVAEDDYNSLDLNQEVAAKSQLKNALEQWENLDDKDKRKTLQITFKKILYSRFDKKNPPQIELYPNE